MSKSNVEYTVSGPDADGRGEFDDGFTVKAGSKVRPEVVPSASEWVRKTRKQLLSDGVIALEDGHLTFVKDYKFRTPSGASDFVLGRSSNGWTEWKQADGTTLHQVERLDRDSTENLLTEKKVKEIINKHEQLVNNGKLLTRQQLKDYNELFHRRFGPEVLEGLQGEELLTFMHDQSNKDSLVCWLEWKNDDEFQTKRLGSIAGGSALKFRIFRRKETGNWQAAGQNSNRPKDITLEEAIAFAEEHRDQLLQGYELLKQFPKDATDDEYALLQDNMDELAPDVSRLAWGHKYFSLMFPELLDDYHNPRYARFHLLKLLQEVPSGDGRYICAGFFVSAAKQAGLCINHLTTVLNRIDGGPHDYWRVGTNYGSTRESHWEMMKKNSCIAIGWGQIGDLSWVDSSAESRQKLLAALEKSYPNTPSVLGRNCTQITQFIDKMAEGDIVIAASGETILGVGRLAGGYSYQSDEDFSHQRSVDWLNLESWKLPMSRDGVLSTVRKLGRYPENLLAIEQRVQDSSGDENAVSSSSSDGPVPKLAENQRRIKAVLERKSQVILYGPPGTGKTYWAEKTANDLAALANFDKPFDALNESERKVIQGDGKKSGLVRLSCFHPAYGYEDFLEGYRPETIDGNISFSLRDGVFKSLCKDARESPKQKFYLIIDEINRGDIPRIFGELLTVLEKDKRGKNIILPVSQDVFSVPKNVFIIGTMNTADRSISLLDAALRRRFGFMELMPDGGVLGGSSVAGIPLRAWFDALNTRIRENVGRDSRNLQIGHSYLMQAGSPLKDLASLKRAIRDDIVPLLEEYSYEDYTTLAAILGEQLVDVASQRICHELFDEGHEEELIQALLAPSPEMTASSEAMQSEEASAENDQLSDADEDEDEDEELEA